MMSKLTNREVLRLASSLNIKIPDDDLVEVRIRLNTSIKLVQDMVEKYSIRDLIEEVVIQNVSSTG